MTFTAKTWKDGEEGGTPITAAELNRIEQGIKNANDILPQYVVRTSADKTDVNGTTITGPCLVVVIDANGGYQGTYYDDGKK